MVKHTPTLAVARTGRKLHLAITEERTLCGAEVNYSVADKAFSHDVSESYRQLMQLCPRCEAKAAR